MINEYYNRLYVLNINMDDYNIYNTLTYYLYQLIN